MIAQPFACTEQGTQFIAVGACDAPTLIGCSGELVKVPPDDGELGDSPPQRLQLLLRQWDNATKVRTHDHRDVCGTGHPALSCTSLEQELILMNKADHQPSRARRPFRSIHRRSVLHHGACSAQCARDEST